MPFSVRPKRHPPVQCAVVYNAGSFAALPMASCSRYRVS